MPDSSAISTYLTCFGYAGYFAGCFGLFLLMAYGHIRQRLGVFLLGIPTFLMAWLAIAGCFGILDRVGVEFAASSLAYSLVFAGLAALVEESFRFGALGIVARSRTIVDRGTVLAYAAGHAAGESLLRGLLRLTSNELAGAALVRDAAYHVLGALIVQARFTVLVFHSIQRRAPWFLIAAMLLHFCQDMPWTDSIGSSGEAISVGVALVAYPCLLAWLLKRPNWWPVNQAALTA